MSRRMQTLQLLLEREQGRRDEARAALRGAQRTADAAHEQARSLDGYRLDYCRRWSAQFAQAGTMEIVRCYQSFIERLDQAIVQQGQQVLATQAALEAAQRRVQEREIRVATIERLMQRHARQIAQAEARREQKTMDEMALRRHGPASAAMLRVA